MPTGIYKHNSPSEATKKRMSEIHKRLWEEGIHKLSPRFTHLGRKHTEKTKKKMSDAKKKNPVRYWLGKKRPDISEKLKGKPLSENHKIKLSLIKIGKYGNKSSAWKGGKPKRHHHFVTRKIYKDWRKAIFEKDNYTCWICNRKGVYLEAHHLKSWAKYPKLRYRINNGMTLCKECHKIYGKYK